MIDQKKRKTLKMITGAGAGLGLAGLPLAGHAVLMASDSDPAKGRVLPSIQVDILAGKAIPGDTVILRNNTSAAMVFDHFTPGIVAFMGSMIDLNMLFQNGPLTIEPQQVMSATVAEWQLLAVPTLKEYLWAGDSAIQLTGDTHVVRLDGVLDGGRVVLSPSQELVYS